MSSPIMLKHASNKIAAWAVAVMLVVGLGISIAFAQSSDPQAPAPQATAEQQKQLDQLKQLEDQLVKDRTALHDAIAKYGWDSDQTDAATDQLSRDRTQYRQLRRALRQAGVAVPPPAGFGPQAGRGMGPGGPRGGRAMRHGAANGTCNCPCNGL